MFKRAIVIIACVLLLGAMAGCQGATEQAEITLEEAASAEGATTDDVDATAATSDTAGTDAPGDSTSNASSEEMPEADFGMDKAAYLTETYGLEGTDNVDLIGYDQVIWLAQNKAISAVVVADADDETSAEMIAAAQEGAALNSKTAYVYEPARDAADGDMDALAQRMVADGITNLEGLNVNTVLILSKLTVGADGNPAPVTEVVTDPADVSGTVSEAFGISCCSF